MNRVNLKEKCHVNSNSMLDTFVGIKSKDGDIEVNFPLGYRLSEDERGIRKDILNLINVLSHFNVTEERLLFSNVDGNTKINGFPMTAFLNIIRDFLSNGYYFDNEVKDVNSSKGKINWSKTIKSKKPFPQETNLYYLDFVVKEKHQIKNNLITLIHQFCVHESINKIGWIFNIEPTIKPNLKFNKLMFLSNINMYLKRSYNDRHKKLFKNMIDIIHSISEDVDNNEIYYGTNRFEYIWEKIIDSIYGISNKYEFFPKTKWELLNSKDKNNKAIEPDTIMVNNNKVFVLDAKYYKYGETGIPFHLPESTSINKQLIYGEYVFLKLKDSSKNIEVYNAFIMPFNKENNIFKTKLNYKNIGVATAEWKSSALKHEHVQGVLLDVKHVMESYKNKSQKEIGELAGIIMEGFQ